MATSDGNNQFPFEIALIDSDSLTDRIEPFSNSFILSQNHFLFIFDIKIKLFNSNSTKVKPKLISSVAPTIPNVQSSGFKIMTSDEFQNSRNRYSNEFREKQLYHQKF